MTALDGNESAVRDAQVVIVGGGPVGLGLAIELGQRGVRCAAGGAPARTLADPARARISRSARWSISISGASRSRCARREPFRVNMASAGLTAYGTLLGPYSYDWMQRELVRPFYFTDNERLPQYATEAVLRRRVGELASVKTLYGWSALEVSQDDGGVSVVIAERRRQQPKDMCGPTMSSAATAAGQSCASRRGITQTLSDHDRLMVLLVFRSHELHGLLEKRHPGKSLLQRSASRTCRATGNSSAGSTSVQTWFFHAPVPAGHDQGQLRLPPVSVMQRPAPNSMSSRPRRLLGPALRRRRQLSQQAASSSPATPPTVIRPMAATASTSAWRTRETSAGSWPRRCRVGRVPICSPPTTRNGGRCSNPQHETSSKRRSETDRKFLAAFSPERDREAFEREWRRASRAHAPRSMLSSPTTKDHR